MMKKVKVLVAQLCPWDSPGKNTEVGCHSFLQILVLICGLFKAMPLIVALVTVFFLIWAEIYFGFPGGSDCKESACSAV